MQKVYFLSLWVCKNVVAVEGEQKCGTKDAACEVACSPRLFHFALGEPEDPRLAPH